MKKTMLVCLLTLLAGLVPAQKYIFYLHGKIVENQGANAVDNTNGFGAYKYLDILDSLKQHRFFVLSEVRPKNTDVDQYALKIKIQIDSLIKTGADPKNITVIGASKGAAIAMRVSTLLKNKNINYVFMAGCYGEDAGEKDLNFYGNVLSIYEKSDQAGGCKGIQSRSTGLSNYKDLEINTGLRHGFLYRPIPEWLNPAVSWANGNYQ